MTTTPSARFDTGRYCTQLPPGLPVVALAGKGVNSQRSAREEKEKQRGAGQISAKQVEQNSGRQEVYTTTQEHAMRRFRKQTNASLLESQSSHTHAHARTIQILVLRLSAIDIDLSAIVALNEIGLPPLDRPTPGGGKRHLVPGSAARTHT